MARPTPTLPKPAELTPEKMRAGVERLRKRIEEVKQFHPHTVKEQYNTPEIKKLSQLSTTL
jgi:hypothetical protein